MKLTNNFKKNVELLQKELQVGKTFDVLERIIDVHNTKFYCYYLDGFVKDTNMEYVRRDMYNLKKEDFKSISSCLLYTSLPSVKFKIFSAVFNCPLWGLTLWALISKASFMPLKASKVNAAAISLTFIKLMAS